MKKREVTAPKDLHSELLKNKVISDYFNSLAYTHKKEYVQWILNAKKTETRKRRISRTIELLKKGIKHPSLKWKYIIN
ncbi:YdeI/OmpD-associated family protein [Bacteroidota bacterium]